MREAAKSSGKAIAINCIGSLVSPFFTGQTVASFDDVVTSDRDAYARYFAAMLDEGIYLAPAQFEAMFASDAHTEDDLKKTLAAVSRTLEKL